MNREIAIKICAFAMDRYGVNTVEGENWRKRMYFLSPASIAELYLQEWINHKDILRWARSISKEENVDKNGQMSALQARNVSTLA